MKYRYFYVGIGSPVGMTAKFVRTEKHLLHPDEYVKFQKKIAEQTAREIAKKTGDIGFTIDPNAILVVSAVELEWDVAEARWPKDFVIEEPT